MWAQTPDLDNRYTGPSGGFQIAKFFNDAEL
jgi:hypothetical protein